ncbi:efflux RND transporter periplasmic adaptor subunit [Vibrio sp. JC009]|uniref:efflux RND transporter periplasmic adaptor subunit n=1 Tax=Vibrio sp. JC009 TaxID=2912314 RepID=UPI0023AFD937|nr:efflux RND transporter periplasmic adaptor subunit [Vibrio sp. JC009]WED22889.1 efflux RND transporter periplasmic adaptor subunit [Vibrio sp. JC009]
MSSNSNKVITFLVGLSLSFSLSGCKDEALVVTEHKPRPVKMIKVSDTLTGNIKKYPAKVSANKEVAVSFQVAGRLVEFPLKPGDSVEKGDLIAKVDNRDFLNQQQLAQADYDLAATNFARYEKLLAKKMISKAQYDSARANLKAAEANLRLAKDRVTDSVVYSPFVGLISETLVENHQYIQPQQTVVILQNSGVIDVEIQLPAREIFRLQEEKVNLNYQPTVTFASDNSRHYPVTYKQHATQVTPGTQSYRMTFTLAAPQEATVYPGMPATMHIDFDKVFLENQLNDYIALPVTAVIKDDASGENYIWIYDAQTGQVHPKAVELGKVTGESVLVKADVEPDDRVVTAGLNRLKEGMEVVPLTLERGL